MIGFYIQNFYEIHQHFTRPTYVPLSEPPPLVWSIRAHLKPIVAVVFIRKHRLLATASSDCSVRLWNLQGRYIGTFGQKQPWSLTVPTQVY